MRLLRQLTPVFLLLSATPLWSQDVLTGNYDNARTNANLTETVLTPANVRLTSFADLFSLPVDGQVYAQPLYQRNLTIGGKAHNVLFAATMRNTVYAYDADVAGRPLWSVNLGTAVPVVNYNSDVGPFTDIVGGNGIMSAPVIDPATGTLYVVAATFESNQYVYRLHALDTLTGKEKLGAPVVIAAQVSGIGDNSKNGIVSFVQKQHLQRPALLLANGNVYVTFGSHGDAVPFHGWIMAYSAANVQSQTAVFNTTPNGSAGAIWQSGRGLAADSAGYVYGVSSNGDTDGKGDFGNSVLKLDPAKLTLTDWFAPFNFQSLSDSDDDIGAAGAMLIPGTNYLVTGGKQGILYLIDRTNPGKMAAGDVQIPQRFDTGTIGIYNMALWNRTDGPLLYLHAINAPVTSWKLQNGKFGTTPFASSVNGFAVPFQGMALSANGSKPGTGVLWVLAPAFYPLPAHAVLHAYDAETLAEVWNSDLLDTDAMGDYVKFVNPTVANGKVYVANGAGQIEVYGIVPKTVSTTPVITGIVNAASYTNTTLAPGEIVAIFGANLGPTTLQVGSFGTNSKLATQLAGVQVTFNGTPGPLLYVSDGAVAAIVPYEVGTTSPVSVALTANGKAAPKINLSLTTTAPGIFTSDASGSGPGAILNADYSLNSPGNPAKAGSIVVLYATGGGITNPPSTTGAVTAAAAAFTATTTVTVGGKAAKVLYSGNAGGEVAGVVQINLQLPAGVTGTVPVTISIGGRASQSTVTVSIQ